MAHPADSRENMKRSKNKSLPPSAADAIRAVLPQVRDLQAKLKKLDSSHTRAEVAEALVKFDFPACNISRFLNASTDDERMACIFEGILASQRKSN
jgi:hypothetical protein